MTQASPSSWARDKLPRMRGDWAGALGQHLRELAPRVFPGVPPEAFVGFAANGRQDEVTSARELGYFGVPAGTWDRLRDSPLVRALLNRDAVASTGDWAAAVRDQVAVGLAQLNEKSGAIAGRLPADVRGRAPDGLWRTALAFAAWSAGEGQLRAHLAPFFAQLARAPESARWTAWLQALNTAAEAGELEGLGEDRHANPAFTALRTWQKLRAGQRLAAAHGGPAGWFSLGLSPAAEAKLEAQITALGNGLDPLTLASAKTPLQTWGWVALGAALGAAGVVAYRRWGAPARAAVARQLGRGRRAARARRA